MRPLLRCALIVVLLAVAVYGQKQTVTETKEVSGGAESRPGQIAWSFHAYAGPELPEDQGITGLWQDLQKLRTTARLMATAAHPDDEPGALLTLEARGQGAAVLMMALTRGEGGQNRTGSELFDELGILRTLELLAADKYYGVERRFSHAADFGFSKTAEETLEKWGGHDPVLSDIVRVIRQFRPDVLVSRFSGTPRDGHGNHQASGILTREAFRAAADPNRFPEQLRRGLQPWQAKKLYVCGFAVTTGTIEINTGAYAPVLGESYAQFSIEGLAHQLSQILPPIVAPGDRTERCELVDSEGIAKSSSENDLFDGIDTSLAGLAARFGAAQTRFLAAGLRELEGYAQQAIAAYTVADPSRCARPLLAGASATANLLAQVRASALPAASRAELEAELQTKRDQFHDAANLALGIELMASVDPTGGAPAQTGPFAQQPPTALFANPSETFTITARLYNRSTASVEPTAISLDVPPGWKVEIIEAAKPAALGPNQNAQSRFRVTVAPNAEYTRPYWHRVNQQEDAMYIVDDARWATLPFPPPPVRAVAQYRADKLEGEARTTVEARYVDTIYGQKERPLAVAPAISLEVEPDTNVVNTSSEGTPLRISVSVRNTAPENMQGTLRLAAPAQWRVEPSELPVKLGADETTSYSFSVTPVNLREQHYELRASMEAGGRRYAEGFRTLTRGDLGAFYYYSPARQDVSAVSVKLPAGLRTGYIMGAGDDIPQVLSQIGMDVQIISPQELASGDLSRYGTIILGIRAYDVRADVRNYNRRLLAWMQNGGTLIVQYNQSVASFNSGHYTPYPATEANQRVTVEQAPVEILEPQNPVLRYPNAITTHDFDDWVQERGLYFMGQWSSEYSPLLACSDPGEPLLKGGLLLAHYGQGIYIYTGYAFFRQLPAGVPGAIRLFVNLVSAGH
ncbi:MAG: PIG-L family deacetylase [Acidobacteria bacterium]|nr:PIG-L family deacetylase [Acidobacteriota bacterium]